MNVQNKDCLMKTWRQISLSSDCREIIIESIGKTIPSYTVDVL